MAPCEPLDDAGTMRDGLKEWGKHNAVLVARWPCPGDTGSLGLVCVWINIVKISTYLQSRLQVHKTEKKGDSDPSPWGMVVRELSCGVNVSGKWLGVSGGE